VFSAVMGEGREGQMFSRLALVGLLITTNRVLSQCAQYCPRHNKGFEVNYSLDPSQMTIITSK
jgi:hypothetical protein